MRPGEKRGTIVLETNEEIDLAIDTLEMRAKDVDDHTAASMLLASELLDDAEAPIQIAAEPSQFILSALECARDTTKIGLKATEIYEGYRKKAAAE